MIKPSRKGVAKTQTEQLSFMQRFGLFFYDRHEVTYLYLLALVVLGALSYAVLMQRQGFPAVDVPVSVVNGTYFVNNRQKVDADITRPATQALSRLPEVESVTSQAGDTFFVIIVRYKEGTTSAAGNTLARATLEDGKLLPPSVQAEYKPINATKFAEEYDLLVSVYGTSKTSLRQLNDGAVRVAAELQKHHGISRATVLKQFESGVDPRTGKTATELRHFDRLGIRAGGSFSFHPSVSIGVISSSGADALKLSDDVHAAVEDIRDEPGNKDLGVLVTADFAEDIREQTSGLQRSLLEGLAVVLLICFLLISWRASVTAALAMFTVVLTTLAILYLTGNTLNTITLFALILSLGLIVDDTVIKVEAIDAAKSESRRKRHIVALAAKRVSLASVAGTATTMLAFAPMLFIGGTLGDFIRVLPVTVIISLAMSLLVSLVLVPLFASGIILRGHPKPGRNPITRLETFVSGGLAQLVLVGTRSRVKGALIGLTAFSIAGALIVASLPFFQKLQFDIFPATKDTNVLQAAISFPPNTSIGQAQTAVDGINARIAQTLGENLERVTYRNSGSPTEALATIDLISFKDRDQTSPHLAEELQEQLRDYDTARIKVSQVDVGPPKEDLPFRAQIHGEDEAKTTAFANDVVKFLSGRTVKRPNGAEARVTRVEIANPTQVMRAHGERVVEVRAGFDADDTSALVGATQEEVEGAFPPGKVAAYGLPEDALGFDFGAETQNQESFSSLLIAFPILLCVMYLLMAFQFKSFLQPLLIFMAIPFSFFGVAVGLYLTDNPLSFFVMVGFFALIGIAVNNTILLTDYANQARKEGRGRRDAIAYAVRARFRPLITTSLTSVVALVPLALSDPFWEALSVTLICGLLSSTFLVVVAFPYIYLGGEVLRIFGSRLWRRQLPALLQYPLDLVIAPIRLLALLLHIIFRHKPA
ncbi:MAG TPA: efflux RND transporter permease subunit [Candidatus Limnocylindria bacterium]|nr:efflux RND transporter permease subunit [Candidatus Limnocylindria bacterium]